MVDLDLLTAQLRSAGHTVGSVIKVPENAGTYEFVIDGRTLTLEETRDLLADDQADRSGPPRIETTSDGTVPTTNYTVHDPEDDRPKD